MPSHTYPASDWRASNLFGVSIRLWQLSDDEKSRSDVSLVVPETAFARVFLRSVMALLKSDLGVDENILSEISNNSLSHLLIKEEVVLQEDEDRLHDGEKDEGESNNNDCCRSKDCGWRKVLLDDGAENAGISAGDNISNESGCILKKCRNKDIPIKEKKKRRKSSKDKTSQTKKKKKKELYCNSCKVSFPCADSLADHVCVRPECCPVCARRFTAKRDLAAHLLIHAGARPHACAACGVAFRHVSTLRRHARAAHGLSKDFACATCGKAFAVRQYLARHELRHTGERAHVCAECGLAFAQAANLGKHARLVHRRESNFVCETCGETFVQRYYLKRHLELRKHGAIS